MTDASLDVFLASNSLTVRYTYECVRVCTSVLLKVAIIRCMSLKVGFVAMSFCVIMDTMRR